MSVGQVVFAVAGALCIIGSVIAVTHQGTRAAGAAFVISLLSLAALCAELGAPAVAVVVIVVALVGAAPLVLRPVASVSRQDRQGPAVAGAAMLIAVALASILAAAISFGEVPVNVSVRSSDGYDIGALRDLLGGRAAVAAGGSVVALAVSAVAVRAARRSRRPSS